MPASNKPVDVTDLTYVKQYVDENDNDALPKWCDGNNGFIKACGGMGRYQYYKIGTITISTAYVNRPLVLELSGRGILYTTLQILYGSSPTADPPLTHFMTNNYNGFYIKKTDTSTWDIFGNYTELWGGAVLHRVTGSIPSGMRFTVFMDNISSIPSDTTQVTYWGHSLKADTTGLLVHGQNTYITSESELNNEATYSNDGITYKIIGIADYYIIPNVSANGFILSIPWAIGTGKYLRQFFIDDDRNTPICVRTYTTNDGFSAWKALAFSDDIPSTYAGSSTAGGVANAALAMHSYDTRDANYEPAHYIANFAQNIVYEFKLRSVINAPGTSQFGNLITFTPWTDNSGGYPVQLYISADGTRAMRNGISDTTWSSWIKLIDESNIDSYLPDTRGAQTVSGNPITVADAEPMNAESVAVELEPKQDLHGYDAPWVGGAGKNICPAYTSTETQHGVTIEGNSKGEISVNGTLDGVNLYAFILSDSLGLKAGTYALNGTNNPNGARLVLYDNRNGNVLADTYDAVTTFTLESATTVRLGLFVYSNVVQYDEVVRPMIRKSTESADFAPYSNICPISGYSEVNVERVGKNLCNHSTITDGVAIGGHGGTYTDETACTTDFIFVKAGEDVAFSTGFRWGDVYDLNENFTKTQIFGTYHAEENCLIRVTFDLSAKSTIQVEYGSTTTYEPYQGNTYTIDLDGTKYGGVCDMTNGSFVKLWEYTEIPERPISESYTISGINVYEMQAPDDVDDWFEDAKCNFFDTFNSTDDLVDNYGIAYDHETGYFFMKFPIECGRNLYEVMDWLRSNRTVIVYPIKHSTITPNDKAFRPTPINLLDGMNNVSTNGTNIELKYQPNNFIGELRKENLKGKTEELVLWENQSNPFGNGKMTFDKLIPKNAKMLRFYFEGNVDYQEVALTADYSRFVLRRMTGQSGGMQTPTPFILHFQEIDDLTNSYVKLYEGWTVDSNDLVDMNYAQTEDIGIVKVTAIVDPNWDGT